MWAFPIAGGGSGAGRLLPAGSLEVGSIRWTMATPPCHESVLAVERLPRPAHPFVLPSPDVQYGLAMGIQEQFVELAWKWAPTFGGMVFVVGGLALANRLLLSKSITSDKRLPRQVMMLLLTVSGLIWIFGLMPLPIELHGQILSLFGLLLTGVIAFSSTTFVANIMGGLMVRAVRSFRPGDFIRIGEHFGRVTERGLFHTEIQTEDRDLVTLPNLYVVTNPVKVVRASGTLVSVRLSLGYDVQHTGVEEHLKQAASDVGLDGPFVHVVELGDFSVTYMVAGFLEDIDRLLTTRSRLRCAVLDRLHDAKIEIVSPNFMNQRVLDPKQAVMPARVKPTPGGATQDVVDEEPTAESVVFDKGSKASALEGLRDREEGLKRQLAEATAETDKGALEKKLERIQTRIDKGTEGLAEP